MTNKEVEVTDEIVFLNKLLDLTVETSTEDENLFYENYRDDILHNINQINGLLTAFGLVKDKLTNTEDILKIEQERASLLRDLSNYLAKVDEKAQSLPPAQKKEAFLSAFGFFGEVVIRHAYLIKKADGDMILFEYSKLKFKNVLAYKGYLKESHAKLMESRRLLFTRVASIGAGSSTVNLDSSQQQSGVAQNTAVDERRYDFDPRLSVSYKTVVQDDAYLLNYTMQLHESTKNSIDSIMNAQDRMDLAALLLYTSSGRNLTWSAVEEVYESWSSLIGKQAVKDNHYALKFKEQAHRLKSLIENHLESSGANLKNIQHEKVLY